MSATTEGDHAATFMAFAQAIFAKAQVLRRPSLTSAVRARLRESISDDIKKLGNLCEPEASTGALEEAKALDVDLFAKTWHDQPSFDGGRELFHLEHVVPVSILREECCAASSPADVHDVLRSRLRVAWILKEEDRRLTAAGHRSKRPDPDAAYRAVEITLVKRSELPGNRGK